MFWPLVLILLACAAFSVLVTRRRTPTPGSRIDPEQVDGFLYVGSTALVVLAAGVVVLGLLDDRNGRAESVAVLGFLAYGLYLAAAVITLVSTRRR